MSLKLKPTLKQLLFIFGKNSYLWHSIGTRLKFDGGELDDIKERCNEDAGRCVIELFDKWLMKNDCCSWSTIIGALHCLKEEKLVKSVEHYSEFLKRMKKAKYNFRHLAFSKTFSPLKNVCYEDQELSKRYFETEPLARTGISPHKEEVIACLEEKSTLWYEMGLFMDMPKNKLDDTEKRVRGKSSVRALRVMFEELIEKFSINLTWREVIDALQDMELNDIAEAIELLGANSVKFPGTTKTLPKRMRRNYFEGMGRQSKKIKEEAKNSRKLHIDKIRETLNSAVKGVSDDDILRNLNKYIVKKNPSISELQEVAESLGKIGEVSVEESEHYTEKAVQLIDDLKVTEKKITQLKDEMDSLMSSKKTLEQASKRISRGSAHADEKALRDLEKDSQEVLQKLHSVYETLGKCISELDEANSDYISICQQLHELKEDVKECKRLLSDLREDCEDISLSRRVKEGIKCALEKIDETDMNIDEVKNSLKFAKHPYINELKQVDPYRCSVEGEGTRAAEVGHTAIAILQTRNYFGKPREAKEGEIDCKLVSRITGASINCKVKIQNKNEYVIKYMPIVKGWHQFTVKIDGNYVGHHSSPFKVAVKMKTPVETLRDPILTITDQHLNYPKSVAVNKEGKIFVTVGERNISVFEPDGTYIQSIGNGGDYVGITIDNENHIIVTDVDNDCIKKFSEGGDHLFSAGISGTGPRQFHWPYTIAYNNNLLYVTDFTSRIQVMNSDFRYLNTITIGPSDWKSIACDSAGLIYLARLWGQFVEILTPDGDHKNQISNNEWSIHSIAVDKDGFLYVVDGGSCCIYVYSSSGEFVTSFGGKMSDNPQGITVDDCGVVYICDCSNNCLKLF